MKTRSFYTITTDERFITRSENSSRVFVVRDQYDTTRETLKYLFQDSHTIFRMRVQKLGALSKTTTENEARSLRVMLETLIQTKDLLRQIK